MALDGVTLAHLVAELAPLIRGARIDKIQQPEKDEIHLLLRQQGQCLRLLLNAGATAARLHLTKENKKNPAAPPMFCMILRKHLEGGKITNLTQAGLERIVTLTVQNYNEYGDLASWQLHLEIMGKHSNLLLVDPGTNVILDGLRRYSHAVSRHREVLPGRPYLAPPSQGKEEFIPDEEKWRQVLLDSSWERQVAKVLVDRFAGISPELAREIVTRAALADGIRLEQCGEIDLARLYQGYARLANPPALAVLEPCLYYGASIGGAPSAFTFVPFQQYHGLPVERLPDLNTAVARFYGQKNQEAKLEAHRGALQKIVLDAAQHIRKKLANYEDALAGAREGLAYQKWGELLTANLYRIPDGASAVTVEDYYATGQPPIAIPLDPSLSAVDNAQRYYRLYNKAKATQRKTEPLYRAALDELAYLDTLLVALDQAADLPEIEEVRTELADQGYIGNHPGQESRRQKKEARSETPRPRAYLSSQGRVILVGKNNRQNDWLALRYGRPHDLWLHVKNTPGSHVLVPLNEGEEFPDDTTLEEAAALAIHFSQARGSTLVPVDYTHVRHLKKPKGAKPGMIVYEQNWTLYLTPQPQVLASLLASVAQNQASDRFTQR